jgi:putative tricarboxylic transport membrane protein
MKRTFSGLIAGALALSLATAAMAADYPNQTIHLVVPWKAGGGTDNIGRGIAKALEEVSGVSVVVDNLAGAGGIKGSLSAAKSNPDGYTVLMNGTTDMTAAMTFKDVPVVLDDYAYIGGFYTTPTWIVAPKERGYKSFKDFLDKAKANPGKLTVGTAGPAGAQMLMASAIKGITGVDFHIIPFSGGADLKKAIIGNQVDVGILHAPVMLPEVKAGLVNVLTAGLPLDQITYKPLRDVKTLSQLGIPVEVGITRGMFVPKSTPQPIVDKLRELAAKAAKSKTFAAFGDKYGFEPVWIPGPQFEKQIRTELAEFKDIYHKYIKK